MAKSKHQQAKAKKRRAKYEKKRNWFNQNRSEDTAASSTHMHSKNRRRVEKRA